MTTQEEINILKGAIKSLEIIPINNDSDIFRTLAISRINDVIVSLKNKQ